MLHVNVDRYHTTNRTATTNGPISLACAAGLGKYGYGNGFMVMECISGTVLKCVHDNNRRVDKLLLCSKVIFTKISKIISDRITDIFHYSKYFHCLQTWEAHSGLS